MRAGQSRGSRLLAIVLLSVALVTGLGVAGGYGLGRVADALRAVWPESAPELASDKAAPPEPIDLSGPADTCAPESLDVRLAADATAITAGDPVTFSVKVTNVGLVPCLVDGSDASSSVVITDAAGTDRVWSSGDCAEGEKLLLLGPGDEWSQAVRWSFVRTVAGCKGGQPAVGPGDYRAEVALADVRGAESNVVNLTVAAPEKPEPTPSPSGETGTDPGTESSTDPGTESSEESAADQKKPGAKPADENGPAPDATQDG